MMQVGMDDLFGKRFQRLSSGNELGEDFGTVALGLDHLLDAIELSDDFTHTGLERLRLFFGVMVRMA